MKTQTPLYKQHIVLTYTLSSLCFQSTYRLFRHIQCAVARIIDLVHRTIFPNSNAKCVEWMNTAAHAMLDELVESDLGPREGHSEECRDRQAWLCFALICRVIPTSVLPQNTNQRKRIGCGCHQLARFKACLCLQALEYLFRTGVDGCDMNNHPENGEWKLRNWNEDIFAVIAAYQKCSRDEKIDLVKKASSSLRWLVLCSSLATIAKVNNLRVAVDDPAKHSAIVEVGLGRCLAVGMELFKVLKDEANPSEGGKQVLRNEYITEDEARHFARLLELLKEQCTPMGRLANAAMMDPNFRRVAYLIQCHVKYISENLRKANYLGSKRVIQHNLGGRLKSDTSKVGTKLEWLNDSDTDHHDKGKPDGRPTKKLRSASENTPRP